MVNRPLMTPRVRGSFCAVNQTDENTRPVSALLLNDTWVGHAAPAKTSIQITTIDVILTYQKGMPSMCRPDQTAGRLASLHRRRRRISAKFSRGKEITLKVTRANANFTQQSVGPDPNAGTTHAAPLQHAHRSATGYLASKNVISKPLGDRLRGVHTIYFEPSFSWSLFAALLRSRSSLSAIAARRSAT
jgi:hypothetical protein